MRLFKPEKLFKPRDFVKPEFIDNSYLEIGAGRGLHACQFAKNNPDAQLIAIERTRVKFEDFAKRAQRLQLANLVPVHADALPWVVHGLAPRSLAGVFLLYPNPEPKNATQRWFNMPFFEFLLSRMKPQAKLILATNIESYAFEAQQKAIDSWLLPAKLLEVPRESARTHFEIKYLARGEACWQLELIKPNDYRTRFDNWTANDAGN